MTLSPEEYMKTAFEQLSLPGMEASKPGLLQSVGKYIKARPWQAGLGAAGLLGGGALAAHLLGRGDEEPEEAEEPEEDAIGGLPWQSIGETGLSRGIGGAITEGAKSLGRAAYLGGRRLLQGRQQRQVFDRVSAEDPILSEADPEALQQSFATMSRFAPTLAADPNAVLSFLREAVTSGGGINYNTIKLLAEAERAAQQV